MQNRKKLGEIFVDQGIITPQTVDRILPRAKKKGVRFGSILEELDLVTGEEMASALAEQYGCKVVTGFADFKFSPELLSFVPVEMALKHNIFPLKQEPGLLGLAMADPTDMKIIENFSANIKRKIIPFIATRQDIYRAICKHYLGRQPKEPNQKTVLVVEDDKISLETCRNTLAAKGFQVIAAVDGMEAFKVVITEKPHVIVTDKELPKMDGFGLLAALQRVPETRKIPVIMMTGKLTNAADEAKALDKGFFDVIIKPVSAETLVSRVKRAFFFYDNPYQLI